MFPRKVLKNLPAIVGLVGFFWFNAKIIATVGAGTLTSLMKSVY